MGYQKQYAGGGRGQGGYADYWKNEKEYIDGHMGRNYSNYSAMKQEYMNMYAGPYKKFMQVNQSSMTQKYMSRYAAPYEKYQERNHSYYEHEYMHQYAGPYEKYIREEGMEASAPSSAKDCR